MGPAGGKRTAAHIIAPDLLLRLFSASNLDALIDTTFAVFESAVRCDFVSAFYRSSGRGLLRERDSRGREYGPAFVSRFAALTPALPLAMANPGIRTLLTRTALPRSDRAVRRSAFYREVMQPQGWRHAVSFCFWAQPVGPAPIFVLSTYREERHRDFSARDVSRLERCLPFIDCAVNRVRECEDAEMLHKGLALTMHDGVDGCAIVDHHLRIARATRTARTLFAAWSRGHVAAHQGAGGRGAHLPPALAEACRELLEQWRSLPGTMVGSSKHQVGRRITNPRDPKVTAIVTIVCPMVAGLGEPTFVIEFERRPRSLHSARLGPSADALNRMTSAEYAVATVLTEGLSNQEIADRLGKSVHAVKFLLHSIYRKTRVPSRTALVAALGREPAISGRATSNASRVLQRVTPRSRSRAARRT